MGVRVRIVSRIDVERGGREYVDGGVDDGLGVEIMWEVRKCDVFDDGGRGGGVCVCGGGDEEYGRVDRVFGRRRRRDRVLGMRDDVLCGGLCVFG